jgi:hypothetical protein
MRTCSIFLLLFLALASHAVAFSQTAAPAKQSAVRTEKFRRTELYFGMSKKDGEVSEAEWQVFLATVVTPRFPDGFTTFEATGQFRGADGKIVREPSRVIVFFYPQKQSRPSSAKIEEIRAAYVKQFQQESVLRMDLPKSVRVSF